MTKYDQFQADLIRFGEGQAQDFYAPVLKLINGAKSKTRRFKASDRFTKRALDAALAAIPTGSLGASMASAMDALQQGVRDTAVSALRASRYTSGSLPLAIIFPPHDGREWREWAALYGHDLIADIRAALMAAYTGKSTVGELRKSLDELKPSALAKARQLATTATRHTSDAVFRQAFSRAGNHSRYPFVRYVATLDSRTSLICANLHGTTWQHDDPAIQAPPRHINCRSYLKPVTTKQAEKSAPSFDSFLRSQSDEYQRSYLGPSRFKLFKNGVSLSPMATADRVLSVAELKRLYPS